MNFVNLEKTDKDEAMNVIKPQFGIQKATQFVVLLERGKGDSVKEIADYWGNSSIDDIYQRVKTWKSQAKRS